MFERIKALFRKKPAPTPAVIRGGLTTSVRIVRPSASHGGASNPMLDTANILSPLHPLNPVNQPGALERTPDWVKRTCEPPARHYGEIHPSRHEDTTPSSYEPSSYSSSSCDSSSSSSDSSSSSSSSDSRGW